jgi:type IV pilus assembly protein PilP
MNWQVINITCLAALVTMGCTGSANDDLRQWMADQQQITRPRVNPIAEPKQYTPLPYMVAGEVDPFNKDKLTQALRREAGIGESSALIESERVRRKEPLEGFPLDAMAMVGSIIKDGNRVALVRVNNLLYQVRAGAYLGQNYGKVLEISENAVKLREIVQDAAGEWVEQVTSLELQESSK